MARSERDLVSVENAHFGDQIRDQLTVILGAFELTLDYIQGNELHGSGALEAARNLNAGKAAVDKIVRMLLERGA